MSRYDVSRFNPPPDQELICGICMNVLDMPKESPCRHVFCKVCIGQALQEKSKCPLCRTRFRKSQLKDVLPLVQNMLNKLTMMCDNYDNGCKELVSLECYLNHVASCDFVMVTCRFNNCGQALLKLYQNQHEKSECLYRDIECTKGCGLTITWKDKDDHQCLEALLNKNNDLMNKNRSLESKLEELDSVISALNNKLQEYESIKTKSKDRKMDHENANQVAHGFLIESDIGSPEPSSSSNSNSFLHDYEFYPTDSSSDVHIASPDFDNFSPEEPDIVEPLYDDDVSGLANDSEWQNSRIEVAASPRFSPPLIRFSPHPENQEVYTSYPEVTVSEQEEIVAGAPDFNPNQAARELAFSQSLEEPGSSDNTGRGACATSRKRFQSSSSSGSAENKRVRLVNDDPAENESEASVRRSRRLQNREPCPADEIPYVDVPPSFSHLLDQYANSDGSSDESWSPSHYSQPF